MWLFQITVSRLRVVDLQFPKNIPLDGCTLLCRLSFDGKVVNLAVSQLSQVLQGSEPVRFRYRLRVSTLGELVATLSQRTATFQVLLLNGSWKPVCTDASREKEYCIGFAATNLLRLAQSECSHYKFYLMAPTLSDSGGVATAAAATGGTPVGRMTVTIFMEQLGEIRLQPTQLQAVGLTDGLYALRCQLFSASSVPLSSSSISSPYGSSSYSNTSGGGMAVSGVSTWSDAALMPTVLVFSGTRRALALQSLQLTLLQLHRRGAETPIVSFTLRLSKLQERLVDKVFKLPFELHSDELGITLCGILQFGDLPVFVGRAHQISIAKHNISLRDENGGGHRAPMMGENLLQKSSTVPMCNFILTTEFGVPLNSDSTVERGTLSALSNQENICFPREGSINSNTSTHIKNSDNGISKMEDKKNVASVVDDVIANDRVLSSTVEEKKDGENITRCSDAIRSTTICEETQANSEHIIPFPPRGKALTLEGISNIHNKRELKRSETYRGTDANTCYTLREIKGMENDPFTSEEQRIRYELARTNMHIAILGMSLKDVFASPLITKRALRWQKATLEQRLECLNEAEASLLQLGENVAERMERCRQMQCELQEEMFRT